MVGGLTIYICVWGGVSIARSLNQLIDFSLFLFIFLSAYLPIFLSFFLSCYLSIGPSVNRSNLFHSIPLHSALSFSILNRFHSSLFCSISFQSIWFYSFAPCCSASFYLILFYLPLLLPIHSLYLSIYLFCLLYMKYFTLPIPTLPYLNKSHLFLQNLARRLLEFFLLF